MSPFQPPVGTPQSVEPPRRPRRRRKAAVAGATVGLLAAGIVGVGQLVSADRSDVGVSTVAAAPPVTTVPTTTVPATTVPLEADGAPVTTLADDPATGNVDVDVDVDLAMIGSLAECLGLPSFETTTAGRVQPGELPDDLGVLLDDLFSGGEQGPFADGELESWLDEWLGNVDGRRGPFENDGTTPDLDTLLDDMFPGRGGAADGHVTVWLDELTAMLDHDATVGQVTVSGPDGVSVIDLGDDGTVTISRDGADISIETGGDAEVVDLIDLDDLLGDLGDLGPRSGEDNDDGANISAELERWLDELLSDLPTADELPEFGSVDAAGVQSCIDDALGH